MTSQSRLIGQAADRAGPLLLLVLGVATAIAVAGVA
jgi:hypothetical protein